MTIRLASVVIITVLGACTRSSNSNPSNSVAPDSFQQDLSNVLEVAKGKGCGPAPLGGWPPRPVKGGVVNDADRAKSLGLVYLVSIYGKKVITLPLSAALKNGVWTVMDAGPGERTFGGERVILICQSNGAVLLTYKTQ